MEIYNEVTINKPIEEVFNFLSNFENLSKWNYYVIQVSKTTAGDIAKGSVFHQVRKTDAQDFKITELVFPSVVAIETLPPERYLNMRFTLRQQGDHTKIEDAWHLKIPRVAAWFVKGKIQSAVGENLQKLKILLETGRVTLQDGRTETLH